MAANAVTHCTILPILELPDRRNLAVLRQTSVDVTDFNEELRELVASMIEAMFAANGIGLAAPQIGRNLNLFVMRTRAGIVNDTREVRVVVNPKTIIEAGEDVGTPDERLERCLSIPGISGRVTRFREVAYVYWDEDGLCYSDALKGMEARIYQHERDHLLGKLFVDLADKFYRPNS